jgi:Divergent InlB B-repeat domain
MISKRRPAGARLLLALLVGGCVGAAQASAAQLTASWVDHSDGAAATRLERRTETGTTFAVLVDVPPGVTQYVDTSVQPGATYCYRALAYDAFGVSPYSDEACGSPSAEGALKVTVLKAGDGVGAVASAPAGIDCGTGCSGTFFAGASVTLTADPAFGSSFDGWSGGCAGTAACVIAGNAPITVTATFTRWLWSGATYPFGGTSGVDLSVAHPSVNPFATLTELLPRKGIAGGGTSPLQ